MTTKLSASLVQFRAQYERNAASLRAMFAEAERTNKTVNNYTAGELEEMALRYENIAAMDDEELRDHLASVMSKISRVNA